MKATTILLLLMFFFPLNAQRFSNQGREEDYRAKRLFKEKYSKQYYERFSGNISVIDEDTIKYDDEVLIISNTNKELKAIFTKGIFYPTIISGPVEKGIQRKKELDLMLIRNDSLRITDFEEMNFLNKPPTVKRFRFWLFAKNMMNPTVYFIELTNNKANRNTDLNTFINDAKLTFFSVGWLII